MRHGGRPKSTKPVTHEHRVSRRPPIFHFSQNPPNCRMHQKVLRKRLRIIIAAKSPKSATQKMDSFTRSLPEATASWQCFRTGDFICSVHKDFLVLQREGNYMHAQDILDCGWIAMCSQCRPAYYNLQLPEKMVYACMLSHEINRHLTCHISVLLELKSVYS